MTSPQAPADTPFPPFVTRLTSWSVLDVTGTQADAFLDGQFTARVGDLDENSARLVGYCQPDGRLIATLIAMRHDAGLRLILPGELADPIAQRLRLFVLRADVDITPGTPPLVAVGGDLPDWVSTEGGRVSRRNGTWAITLDGATPLALLGGVDLPSATTTDDTPWHAALITAGAPPVYAATSGLFLPQSLRLQQRGGLDFKKGCYPGQEVVARLHYRGKLTRVLARVTSPAGPLTIGETLIADGQSVGVVAESAGSAGLAVVQARSLTAEAVVRGAAGDVQLQPVDPLPPAATSPDPTAESS